MPRYAIAIIPGWQRLSIRPLDKWGQVQEWIWFSSSNGFGGERMGKNKKKSCKEKGRKEVRDSMKAKKIVMHLQKKKNNKIIIIMHKQWAKKNMQAENPHPTRLLFRFCVHHTFRIRTATKLLELQPKLRSNEKKKPIISSRYYRRGGTWFW